MDEAEEVEETRVMELFRSKWALSVLLALSDGELRFNELKRSIGSAPSNTLSGRLSELEDENLITRTIRDESPPQVCYGLTERGERVADIIERIEQL